jgi:hypothetical protein
MGFECGLEAELSVAEGGLGSLSKEAGAEAVRVMGEELLIRVLERHSSDVQAHG